jgi:hypothetical protein
MKNKPLSPLKAIRKYCKEQCCASDKESWVNCSIVNCALYNYRLGEKIKYKNVKNQVATKKDDEIY